jgi:putative transposase
LSQFADTDRRIIIEPSQQNIPIIRQCELVGVPRSSFYFKPKGETPYNIALMHLIDKIYTKQAYLGYPKIHDALVRRGHKINLKRVARLMRVMGLQAIHPKKNTSKAHPNHPKYPYLLRGVKARYPNHIWGTDITYIRLEHGFCYLVALLDWYSRYVIAWELSLSMKTDFCLRALNKALETAMPWIHNSDQGVQFTDKEYTGILDTNGIQISMDGRGRCFDNIFTERLWRSVKYEEVYLKGDRPYDDTLAGLTDYFQIYNHERPHQSLGYKMPAEVYFG